MRSTVTTFLVGIAGCGTPHSGVEHRATAPPQSTVEPDETAIQASRGFQAAYDRGLREEPASFLTVVAAFYVAPRSSVNLQLDGDRWIEIGDEPGHVRLEAAEDRARLVHAGRPQVISQATLVELQGGRWRLEVARQSGDWRLLIHDRDAAPRRAFEGVDWFPIEPELIVSAIYAPSTTREPIPLLTSRGLSKVLYEAGTFEFRHRDHVATLHAYGYTPQGGPGEPLLIPFRDGTTGTQSYGAGRYLELDAPPAGPCRLDFNRATNPLCAYSEHYNCPFPPPANRLPFPVRAGAKDPH